MASPPQSPRHWVIGDVHGCATALQDLISRLPPSDRLIFCGDLINRGPQIERSMILAWDLVAQGRATWLRGNHEQNLLKALSKQRGSSHQALAGCDTYRQLGSRQCRLWRERLESLPLAHWGQGWVATHAGFDPGTWLPHLSIRQPFWKKYDGRFGDVIIGHTPVVRVERSANGIVKIDTGACYGGRLSAYCPETGEGISVPGLRSIGSQLPAPGRRRTVQSAAGSP
jgi:serine/threonine protein phosphatase 1